MTVEELIKKLRTYAEQGVQCVTDSAGREIERVYDPAESVRYVVITMTDDDDGMTINEIINELEKCTLDKLLITDAGADIEDTKYECLIEPTAVLVYYNGR